MTDGRRVERRRVDPGEPPERMVRPREYSPPEIRRYGRVSSVVSGGSGKKVEFKAGKARKKRP